ncbi:MFS transporter [Kineococcus indalonis]|uniref:MFS transporter n=1 Tax=Kineococcus indalonis TaxID=2696566 RepID=UPI001413388C|nr:MFS transporter [Kineococcus indalonis]NAZ85739.1 MFS transporter [Kineococcus indalonis]
MASPPDTAAPALDAPRVRPTASPARLRALLVLLCTPLGLVIAANSSLALALPSVGADLRADQSALTWAVDAYSLFFAALLLPAGIAADRFGQRTLLVCGLLVFGAGNLASAFATSVEALIVLRAVSGIGAAAVFPVTLSALVSSFPPERRGFAIAVWSGVSAGGSVVGLLAAGALLEAFWWGSVQVLFGAAALLLVPGVLALVGQHRDPHLSLDLPGALLAVVALSGVVFAVLEAPLHGWTSVRVLLPLALGLAGAAGFVLRELRTPEPALDVRLFRSRGLAVGSLLVVAQFFTALGLFTLLPQYLQIVPGYSALQAALVLLALSVGAGAGSAVMGARGAGWGSRGPAAVGLLLMATGFFGLATAAGTGRLWHVVLALVVFGAGFGASMIPGTSLILEGLPPERRSVASAVNDITREVGGVLGIAVMSSVLVATYREDLLPALVAVPAPLAEVALGGAGPAQAVAQALGPAGEALRLAAADAFAAGFADAFVLASGVLAVAALACGALAPSRRRPGRHVRERTRGRPRSSSHPLSTRPTRTPRPRAPDPAG